MYGRRQFNVCSCWFIIYIIKLYINCLLLQKEIINYDSQYDWERKCEINISIEVHYLNVALLLIFLWIRQSKSYLIPVKHKISMRFNCYYCFCRKKKLHQSYTTRKIKINLYLVYPYLFMVFIIREYFINSFFLQKFYLF